jgi:hypothetical protein
MGRQAWMIRALGVCVLVVGCGGASQRAATGADPARACPKGEEKPMDGKTEAAAEARRGKIGISAEDAAKVESALAAKFGAGERERIHVGVAQAAALWWPEDGSAEEFEAFCLAHFAANEEERAVMLARFENNLEQVTGHLHEISMFLREPVDLDRGPLRPFDKLFAEYDLSTHAIEDMFTTKIAFAVLLNFRQYTLREKLSLGPSWSRDDWARAAAADIFDSRVPSEVEQEITAAFVAGDAYINDYNIFMHNLVQPDGSRPFPKGLKLISHWGLRDELKAQYGVEGGLARQRLIQTVMEKIIAQEIPAAVVNNPRVDWKVGDGALAKTPSAELEDGVAALPEGEKIDPAREADTRYAKLLEIFRAVKKADPYTPSTPSYVARKFELERQIPKGEVEKLLTDVLGSPAVEEVAALIAKRLGRPLEPFDIWYDGFVPRGGLSEAELDEAVRKAYPTVEAFQKKLPRTLGGLGFDKKTAAFLSSKIVVDPARGAGHAAGAERREDSAHLRTRVPPGGMDYKGYNIAMHELGHNVEQVFSLNRMDHTLLHGTPNTSFTEGFAFAFQAKDVENLGLREKEPLDAALLTLDAFWSAYEISGVGLVDIRTWDYLYAHPEATPAELREAVIEIAKAVWNEFYAGVFGVRDVTLLAVYSHIIDAGLYIPDYPMGFLIQFQMEEHFAKHGLATEMERMCKAGAITPNAWMQAAVGAPISAQPIIAAAREAAAEVAR